MSYTKKMLDDVIISNIIPENEIEFSDTAEKEMK